MLAKVPRDFRRTRLYYCINSLCSTRYESSRSAIWAFRGRSEIYNLCRVINVKMRLPIKSPSRLTPLKPDELFGDIIAEDCGWSGGSELKAASHLNPEACFSAAASSLDVKIYSTLEFYSEASHYSLIVQHLNTASYQICLHQNIFAPQSHHASSTWNTKYARGPRYNLCWYYEACKTISNKSQEITM